MGYGWYIAAFIIAIVCGIGTRAIAKDKGRSESVYFWVGFFFCLIGLIIVACLPDRFKQYQKERARMYENPEISPKLWCCPQCHEINDIDLEYCSNCYTERRQEVRDDSQETVSNADYQSAYQSFRMDKDPETLGARQWMCKKCSAMNSSLSTYCKSCGEFK